MSYIQESPHKMNMWYLPEGLILLKNLFLTRVSWYLKYLDTQREGWAGFCNGMLFLSDFLKFLKGIKNICVREIW